jgi:anti-sigma B factor antagonist
MTVVAPGVSETDVDGVHVLSVSGELDLAAAVPFCALVDSSRSAGHRRLLLDLTDLEFCDSRGLRALIRAVDEVHASAGRVAVVPPADGAVARTFTLSGAGELLPLCPSADDGVALLAG